MKLNTKVALAVAALALGASAAQASIPAGDIVLNVYDIANSNNGVTIDTGLGLSTWNPATNFSLTLTSASVLAAFNVDQANTTWGLVGSSGTNFYTSANNTQTLSMLGSGAGDNTNGMTTARNQMAVVYSQITSGVATNITNIPWAGSANGGFGQAFETTDNQFVTNTDSLNFEQLTSSASPSLYNGSWTLTFLNASGGAATQGTAASAVLTWTSNAPPVPLPAAVWLLGSGLAGLAGVGRRRQKAAA